MEIFKPGKLTIVMDGGAGSSAKGLRGAYLWKYFKEDHSKFSTNTFLSNAAHTITHKDGREYIHQCLSSITSVGGYEKQYLSPGCAWSKDEILNEMKLCDMNPSKLGINPNAIIVTQNDIDYEKGLVDFEGNKKEIMDSANLRIGSTLHGVGAARARRVLRRSDVVLAKDLPELKDYISNTNFAMMARLNKGESGLGEIAQGYQLSMMSRFYPKTTSRNCTVAAFLDDSMLPPTVIGPTIVNFRTFPIRVNNNKYVRKSDGKILTWDEYAATPDHDKDIIRGDSGAHYADQAELTWDQISDTAGEKVFECTSLTKLPRRVFTFSKSNLKEALVYNNTGDDMYISVNFINYVDAAVKEKSTKNEVLTSKVVSWIKENIWSADLVEYYKSWKVDVKGLFLGTGRSIDDSIFLSLEDLKNL